MDITLKKLVLNQILETASANNLNNFLKSRHGRHLSVNNYMRVETAMRLRRMTNQQIIDELRFLNNRRIIHTRPNNRNAIGIILRRQAELYGEQARRAAI